MAACWLITVPGIQFLGYNSHDDASVLINILSLARVLVTCILRLSLTTRPQSQRASVAPLRSTWKGLDGFHASYVMSSCQVNLRKHFTGPASPSRETETNVADVFTLQMYLAKSMLLDETYRNLSWASNEVPSPFQNLLLAISPPKTLP
jgi:hypothetical protein